MMTEFKKGTDFCGTIFFIAKKEGDKTRLKVEEYQWNIFKLDMKLLYSVKQQYSKKKCFVHKKNYNGNFIYFQFYFCCLVIDMLVVQSSPNKKCISRKKLK